jgi:hypothetical protein
MVDPASATWYLRNTNSAGFPDFTPFSFGLGAWQPLGGRWAQPGAARQAGALGVAGDGTFAALAQMQDAGITADVVGALLRAQHNVDVLTPGALQAAVLDAVFAGRS